MIPDLTKLSIWLALPVFLGAAAAVWMAGSRMTRYANIVSVRTGAGQALIGLLVLGGVTSLPELAVALSSSVSGDASLAVNSVLGGIAMQVAILALADAAIGRTALTHVLPDPTIFFQGACKILLLSIVTAAIVVGDTPVLAAGTWMWLLLLATGAALWILSQAEGRLPWRVSGTDVSEREEDERSREAAGEDKDKTLGWALWRAAVAAIVIIAAGYVLSRTAVAIAQSTGLGQSFVGTVFLAIATSLPEVSTVFTAVRAGLYTMAVSDIFGTNLFDLSFLFIVDLTGGDGAVMNDVGPYEAFAAIIAISVTAIFMAGLAERRSRTIFRMGYDSAAVLAVYLCGLAVLYFLKDTGAS